MRSDTGDVQGLTSHNPAESSVGSDGANARVTPQRLVELSVHRVQQGSADTVAADRDPAQGVGRRSDHGAHSECAFCEIRRPNL